MSGQLTEVTGGDANIFLVVDNWPIAMILPFLIQRMQAECLYVGKEW